MASTTFSREERLFVAGGVQVDLRIDGRSCTDYRHFNVKYGIVTSANGSAEVKLVSIYGLFIALEFIHFHFISSPFKFQVSGISLFNF